MTMMTPFPATATTTTIIFTDKKYKETMFPNVYF